MNQLQPWYHRVASREWIFFYGIAFLNLLPAVSYAVFPSLDGPAHLHNANLIYQLLFGDADLLSQYYAFNSDVVPNWGGHFVLTLLYTVCSPLLAGKIFIGLCLFLLPASFRYCVKHSGGSVMMSYLIFPFTYTFMFCLGFYNFSAGLIVLFTAIGMFMRYRKNPLRIATLALLFVLLLLAYLSHLFVFLSLGMVLFFTCSLDLIQAFLRKEQLRETVRKTVFLFIAALPALLLTVRYFLQAHHGGDRTYLLKSELMQWLTSCRSSICYSVENESPYTTAIFLLLAFLASIAAFMRSNELKTTVSADEQRPALVRFFLRIGTQDLLLVITLAFVVLYFRLPDADPTAGYISMRLLLMVFLFLVLWIARFTYPKWIMALSLGVILVSQYKLVVSHNRTFKEQNVQIAEILDIEKAVKANTVVLPVNYSNNWLATHNSNYLGMRKPVVILENYECVNTYFPLCWKGDKALMNLVHETSWNTLDALLDKTPAQLLQRVDYIFVQGKETFPDSTKTRVLETFQLRRETPHYLLFQRK